MNLAEIVMSLTISIFGCQEEVLYKVHCMGNTDVPSTSIVLLNEEYFPDEFPHKRVYTLKLKDSEVEESIFINMIPMPTEHFLKQDEEKGIIYGRDNEPIAI